MQKKKRKKTWAFIELYDGVEKQQEKKKRKQKQK